MSDEKQTQDEQVQDTATEETQAPTQAEAPAEEKATPAEAEAPAEETKEETPAEEPAAEEAKEEAPAPEAEAATEAPAEEAGPAEETPAEEVTEEVKEEAPAEMPYKAKLSGMDDLVPGQTVRLHERIKDVSPKGEERERIQIFEGIILGMGGSGITRTVTLRKVSKGYGVEKIYPINSPVVAKVELVKTAKVRRAKLNYLKNPKRRFKRKLKETLSALGMQKKKKKR